MRRPPSKSSVGILNALLDATISLLIKAMIAAFVIGAVLVVASEFYEPALGRWSILIATPYALIIPMYAMKLTLKFYERTTRSFLKHK